MSEKAEKYVVWAYQQAVGHKMTEAEAAALRESSAFGPLTTFGYFPLKEVGKKLFAQYGYLDPRFWLEEMTERNRPQKAGDKPVPRSRTVQRIGDRRIRDVDMHKMISEQRRQSEWN